MIWLVTLDTVDISRFKTSKKTSQTSDTSVNKVKHLKRYSIYHQHNKALTRNKKNSLAANPCILQKNLGNFQSSFYSSADQSILTEA